MSRLDRASQVGLFVDSRDFRTLFARSSLVEQQLRTTLRRNIRTEGKRIVSEVQAEAQRGSYKTNRGLRRRIAAGVQLSISTEARRPGVAIRATPKAMQPGEGNLVAAWQARRGWRHPVRGNAEKWVPQIGRPGFFYSTVSRQQPALTRVVRAAMVEAADSLRKR
ncbi:hypothetical protein [Nocardioides jejuensis]|uniref:Uncharacterized protein n=1 Tax=Nocardioides jejuensis TaxID=2502782 RepID=A0A4R1BY74_9ACTN|nr:hypothetical protein [Nocardioides jejuensis]TCJ23020.1 hypothetical protein EPD65_11705 [Nocardioides jejuensis]